MPRGRRSISMYVAVASLLAAAKLGLYFWLVHRYLTHTVTDAVIRFEWFIYPEEFVSINTAIGRIENKTIFLLIFGLMLIVGSFVIASPILLITSVEARPSSFKLGRSER